MCKITLKSHNLRLNKCPCFYIFSVGLLGVELKFTTPCILVDVTSVSEVYTNSIFMLVCG